MSGGVPDACMGMDMMQQPIHDSVTIWGPILAPRNEREMKREPISWPREVLLLENWQGFI